MYSIQTIYLFANIRLYLAGAGGGQRIGDQWSCWVNILIRPFPAAEQQVYVQRSLHTSYLVLEPPHTISPGGPKR
jgi:hypothetical protein